MERVKSRMKKTTEDEFRATVTGYDSVITENSNVNISDSKTTYALYPVWLLTTVWNDERYIFAMNGQTGKFVGNLPCDKGLFWKYFFISFGIGAVIIAAIMILLNLL